MVEGREDSAILTKVVWMSLSGTQSSQHTNCVGWAHTERLSPYVNIILIWGKTPGLLLTLRPSVAPQAEWSQGRTAKWLRQRGKWSQAVQVCTPRKETHKLQISISCRFMAKPPSFQRILMEDWLQHSKPLRKINVRREIWPFWF